MYNPIHGAIKTFMDGIRDSHSQYEMARSALDAHDHEFARLHAEEAERRLAGAKMWYDKVKASFPQEHEDHVRDALLSGYMDWYHSVCEKVKQLRAEM